MLVSFLFASSEKSTHKEEKHQTGKARFTWKCLLADFKIQYKWQSLNLLCRSKQYRYNLLQYILKSTVASTVPVLRFWKKYRVPVPRYFLKPVPSTGTAVLYFVPCPSLGVTWQLDSKTEKVSSLSLGRGTWQINENLQYESAYIFRREFSKHYKNRIFAFKNIRASFCNFSWLSLLEIMKPLPKHIWGIFFKKLTNRFVSEVHN